jgi:hypothetical protein
MEININGLPEMINSALRLPAGENLDTEGKR